MKILFTFVGNQDPFSEQTNQEGSIVTLVRHLRPDWVYMLPSADGPAIRSSTQRNAEETSRWIATVTNTDGGTQTKVVIFPLHLSDPRDTAAIMSQGRDIIYHVLSEIGDADETEFFVNTSSGTPQMKMAMMLWANTGVIPHARVMEVGDPRYTSERIQEVNVGFLEVENARRRGLEYLKGSQYEVAAEELRRVAQLTPSLSMRMLARLMADLLATYHLWDNFEHKEVASRIARIERSLVGIDGMTELVELLREQQETVKKITTAQNENQMNLLDLYHNAVRCYTRRNYTDTLARSWRLFEGSLYHQLRVTYDVEPTNLTQSGNKENRGKAETLVRNGLRDLSFALASKGLDQVFRDVVYKDTMKQNVPWPVKVGSSSSKPLRDALEELRQKRNDSIVAHGMQPVSQEVALGAVNAMQAFLLGMMGIDKTAVEDYCFSHARVVSTLTPVIDRLR